MSSVSEAEHAAIMCLVVFQGGFIWRTWSATPVVVGGRPLLSRTLPAGIPPAVGNEARALIAFRCGGCGARRMMEYVG